MADASDLYSSALHECSTKVTDPMTAWKQKVDDLGKIKDWDKVSAQIYKDHKDEVDLDIKDEFVWWDKSVQFNSGMFAGRMQKIFIDNAPKQDDFLQ